MLGGIIPSCENNWSPVVAGEKGEAKMNGLQAFSPVGLKVLVVDDNRVCLAILEKMLKQCNYSVTTCNSAAAALSLVQKNCTAFDLVLCDVHMPGMDGFKLLEAISLEQDLPVVMMSSDEELEVVKKFVTNGACDYLFKPVCLRRLQTIWLHVYRKQRELRECMNDGDCTGIDNGRSSRFPSDRDSFRKRKGKEEAMDEPVGFVNGSKKKARLVWTRELHKLFVEAVTHLGMANAVPKQILEKMNVKGISRENVASHLQKYRKYITDQGMSVDLKDPVGGMNMLSHSHEPFQAGGIFGGSIEVQPPAGGAVSYTVPSIHAPFCHSYGGHTDLYPVPSQSFRAIEAGITSPLGDTRSDPMAFPSMDTACSSNFLNRMRQFQGNFQVPQILPPPAFYCTEYDS